MIAAVLAELLYMACKLAPLGATFSVTMAFD